MTLGRWIEDRARITPGRVAIDFEDRLVTYAELDVFVLDEEDRRL